MPYPIEPTRPNRPFDPGVPRPGDFPSQRPDYPRQRPAFRPLERF